MEKHFNPYAAPSTLNPATKAARGTLGESARAVATGLRLYWLATLVMLLCNVSFIAVEGMTLLHRLDRRTAHLIHDGVGWSRVGSLGIAVLGSAYCLRSRPRTWPRAWVGSSILTGVLSMVVCVGTLAGAKIASGPSTSYWLGAAASALFLVFLWNLARLLKSRVLAGLAAALLICSGMLAATRIASDAIYHWMALNVADIPLALIWVAWWALALLPIGTNVLGLMLLCRLKSAILVTEPTEPPSPSEGRPT